MSEKEKRIKSIVKLYYSNPGVQEAIFSFSKDRETVPSYMMESFGKRPDSLQYPSEIMNLVNKGATSFHCSEELWKDPLGISSEMTSEEISELRKGWDLLIDIDSPYLDCSKIAAKLILKELEEHGVFNYKIKFSGSKGFHIIVPSIAFPKYLGNYETRKMFPEWPRAISEYLMYEIRQDYNNEITKLDINFEALKERTNISREDISYILCPNCNSQAEKTNKVSLECDRCKNVQIKPNYKITKRKLRCIEESCSGFYEIKEEKEIFLCKKCDYSSLNKTDFKKGSIIKHTKEAKSKYLKDFKEEVMAEKLASLDLVLVAPRHLFRMPYSVDFDEPIILKNKRNIRRVKLGEFVDKFFSEDKDFQIKDILNLGYETVSFNLKNNKSRFSRISKVIRHKIKEDLFKITLESGRKVKVTSGHSLFILKDGKIKTIKGSDVKKEDYLVVLKKSPSLKYNKKNLIISEELTDKTPNKEKKNIFLCDFDLKIFDKIYKLKIPERKKGSFYNWKVYKILPLDVYEVLTAKKPYLKKEFRNANIKMSHHGGGAKKIPNKIKIDKNLMRLLGYYISEGHCDKKRNRVCFSFGSHEKELIEDCIKILNLLNFKPNIRKPHKTAVQIEINSTILKLILTSLFDCGEGAQSKRVPLLIWKVNNSLKKEFIKSYIKGDGHLEKRWSKIVISTASKGLQEDLCFLLSSIRIDYSLTERNNVRWSKNSQHLIIIQGRNNVGGLGFKTNSKTEKESLVNKYPIRELGLESDILKSRWKNQYIEGKIVNRNENFIRKLNTSQNVLDLINGDASFIRVKEIKKIKSIGPYVYDISVENDENFLGGNCILLHNSLHEKTALASIVLTKEQIKNFNPQEANPLRVKILDFYPKATEGEASLLLESALKWKKSQEVEEESKTKKYSFEDISISGVTEEMFPKPIKKLLKGLRDGKKRGLFILLTFLKCLNFPPDYINAKVREWNKKNQPPLKEGYVKSQIDWHLRQRKKILPPNYSNQNFYKDLNLLDKTPNAKNPLSEVVRILRMNN